MRKVDKLNVPIKVADTIYNLVEVEGYYNANNDKKAIIWKVARKLNLRTWIIHAVINQMDLSKWNY